MRTIITMITIALILSGGSLASYRYVETRTQTMGALLESVENSIAHQKWEAAQNDLNTAQQNWNNDNTYWTIILDDRKINDISINMKRLGKYIKIQEVSESVGEVTTLKLLFEHISDTELFNIKNIF